MRRTCGRSIRLAWVAGSVVSGALAACDPGASFAIWNPCAVALEAAVFLDPGSVPARVSDRKLVLVPPRDTATDADLGEAGDVVALVVGGDQGQRVFEVPYGEKVSIPEEACALDEE